MWYCYNILYIVFDLVPRMHPLLDLGPPIAYEHSTATVHIPNQPHLLNKYQIIMDFSHFHEIGILSGINILSPYQIDIKKDVVSTIEKLY